MYPGADPAMLVPGSITFAKPSGPVDLSNPMWWWAWTPGAQWWRHPWGPASNLDGKEDHPVTQVTWEDAEAYRRWAGKGTSNRGSVGTGRPWRNRRAELPGAMRSPRR